MAVETAAPPKEVTDKEWIRQAFFIPRHAAVATGNAASFSSANTKFYDTTPGGNKSINPVPQFTRTADIKQPSLAVGSKGMGRYYSEAIDDNQERISLQFGVAEYNSLSTFMANFYDADQGTLANTGRADTGLMYAAGKVAGTLFTLPVQAYFGLSYIYDRISSSLSGKPYSKFYYMSPRMPLYWNAASMLLNQITNNMGITQGLSVDNVKAKGNAREFVGGTVDQDALRSILPDIMRGSDHAGIDLYAVATRGQRLANNYYKAMDDLALKSGSEEDYNKKVAAKTNGTPWVTAKPKYSNVSSYMAAYLARSDVKLSENDKAIAAGKTTTLPVQSKPEAATPKSMQKVMTNETELIDFARAELQDGSAFVNFAVNNVGSVSESFSSSVKATSLEETMNGISSTSRDLAVNFAGGNVMNNAAGDAVGAVLTGVSDLLKGALDSVGLSGVAALGGAAFVDISQVYDTSDATMTSTTYTMKLGTPYGNKMSILTNIMMPLACILAGALPRSTGKNSYTSPPLCRLHSQGKVEVKTGMITALEITRGTSNIQWTGDRLPTAIDVSFTVTNMDNVMHMPIADSLLKSVSSFSFFDEDSAFSDYLAALSGLSLYDQFYMAPRAKLAWAKTKSTWKDFTSPAHMAQYAVGTAPGKIISGLAHAGAI